LLIRRQRQMCIRDSLNANGAQRVGKSELKAICGRGPT
jgi:hypothetical protein